MAAFSFSTGLPPVLVAPPSAFPLGSARPFWGGAGMPDGRVAPDVRFGPALTFAVEWPARPASGLPVEGSFRAIFTSRSNCDAFRAVTRLSPKGSADKVVEDRDQRRNPRRWCPGIVDDDGALGNLRRLPGNARRDLAGAFTAAARIGKKARRMMIFGIFFKLFSIRRAKENRLSQDSDNRC